ncbi:MAG: glycosyltransferase [Alphaproteobacteria bacterium]|nr:glycosyltransferase [Alphaproteobacteria bacterium]
MNDALKILSRALRPFGYQIRRFQAPNLLRIPNLEDASNRSNVTIPRAMIANDFGGHGIGDSALKSMVIFLRSCVRADRNINKRPRITGHDGAENARRCIQSLVRSVQHSLRNHPDLSLRVIALDDRSDPEFQKALQRILSALPCPWELRQTEISGQGASLYQQFSEARAHNALVYFCEDDYLHEPEAIAQLWTFYKESSTRIGTHMVLYPQEHAVLYADHYPSYLVLGADRHWRTMRHATHTFMTHGHVVRDNWKYFENTKFVGNRKKRRLGSEARTTNLLFKHIPGFSPLKPLAVHLQFEETLPPLYDWRPLWEASAP